MGYSFLGWNVEHFKPGAGRLQQVAQHIRNQGPDAFGLFEVEDLAVMDLMEHEFSDYDFGITDGQQSMEILVGWRRAKFTQAIFTQKREFKAYNPSLRPGALLTVRVGQDFHNLLFLHTDSGTDAAAFGNRFEMFARIWKLKRAIDRMAEDRRRLIVLGDLNTMGLFYPTGAQSNARVAAEEEIGSIRSQASGRGMRLLIKDEAATWTDGAKQSNLDHVVASQGIQFVTQGVDVSGNPAEVAVRGWNQLAGAARGSFISDISDHSSLLAEVV